MVVAIVAISFWLRNISPPKSTTSSSTEATTAPLLSKFEFLNETAQHLDAAKLSGDYCATHLDEKLCKTRISSHIPEFQHHDVHVEPQMPITFTLPEPCNMLCLTWEPRNNVDISNRGPDPITILVVTVSIHNGSAEPTPVWFGTIGPGQTTSIPLLYGDGSHVGIIVYYP